MGTLQEKFQHVVPEEDNDNAQNGWLPLNSALVPRPVSGGYCSRNSHLGKRDTIAPWQTCPQEMDEHINNIAAGHDPAPTGLMVVPHTHFPLVTSGRSDRTPMASEADLLRGWAQHPLVGADDQYTDEHTDHFYGEAIGTDDYGERVVGFIERNNYLDRL